MDGWEGGGGNRGTGRKKECSKEESTGRKEEEYAPLLGARSRCVSMATNVWGGGDTGEGVGGALDPLVVRGLENAHKPHT